MLQIFKLILKLGTLFTLSFATLFWYTSGWMGMRNVGEQIQEVWRKLRLHVFRYIIIRIPL